MNSKTYSASGTRPSGKQPSPRILVGSPKDLIFKKKWTQEEMSVGEKLKVWFAQESPVLLAHHSVAIEHELGTELQARLPPSIIL